MQDYRHTNAFYRVTRRFVALAPHAPEGSMLVSESGISGPSEIAMLRACGFQAFLVGETLMRAGQPEETLRSLVGQGKFNHRDTEAQRHS